MKGAGPPEPGGPGTRKYFPTAPNQNYRFGGHTDMATRASSSIEEVFVKRRLKELSSSALPDIRGPRRDKLSTSSYSSQQDHLPRVLEFDAERWLLEDDVKHQISAVAPLKEHCHTLQSKCKMLETQLKRVVYMMQSEMNRVRSEAQADIEREKMRLEKQVRTNMLVGVSFPPTQEIVNIKGANESKSKTSKFITNNNNTAKYQNNQKTAS